MRGMIRSAVSRALFCAFLCAAACAAPALAAEAPKLDARGAIVMNLKSESVLYIQTPDKRVPPASLAKIMTLYVTMDHIASGDVSLDDKVKISARAAGRPGAKMGLKPGDVVPFEQLLLGTAVASGNDAATAVAEHVAGSEKAFVALMNAKAAELGMKNTKFRNPHGLPPAEGQWTTARDMLTLSKRYIEDHPDALRYHGIGAVTYGKTTTTNKNKLLSSCPGVDGLKTGWITASGYSLVSTAKRGDIRLIAVLLGASTANAMAEESRFLVEAGFTTVASGGKNKVTHQLKAREDARKKAQSAKKAQPAKTQNAPQKKKD